MTVQLLTTLCSAILLFSSCKPSVDKLNPIETIKRFEDNPDLIVRLAELNIDSLKITEYTTFLKEEIEASVTKEPGVLTMYAVQDESDASQITILEIYANDSSYQAHLASPHFQKYKQGTLHMVKSLELVDLNPIIFGVRTSREQ